MQAALRVEHGNLVQCPSFQRRPVLGLLRCSDQGLHRITLRNFLQQRKCLISQAVTDGDGLGIARIFPPVVALRLEPSDQVGMADAEQRSDQFEPRSALGHQRLLRLHPFKAMRSPQQIPQHRLRLIIRMVGQQNPRAAEFNHTRREKPMALMPRRRLQRLTAFRHPPADICGGNLAANSEFLGQTADESGILGGRPAPQPVVEMTADEVAKSSRC